MDTCCCMATILLESMVMAVTACANCSSRKVIGNVGEGWMAGVKSMNGSENSGDVGW